MISHAESQGNNLNEFLSPYHSLLAIYREQLFYFEFYDIYFFPKIVFTYLVTWGVSPDRLNNDGHDKVN